MRLHRLRLNAFGPFAGSEEVDFDQLGAGGLFLLHGPTGAGKSSVLDAVCFALYGRLPGARGAARPHVRSDHAGIDSRPEVELELTIGGRRLRVTRSPEWLRPKRRGAGLTPEKATASLREWRAGDWQVVSTRADEIGHELQDLLGMRLDQFTKVVLLPQGEFEAFLRSDAEARRGLLEQLFATGRFSDVETWLAGRRRELGREVAQVRAYGAQLLARADEHAAQLSDAVVASGPTEAAVSVAELAMTAVTLTDAAAGRAETAATVAEAAAGRLGAGRLLATHQSRLAVLSGRADQLADAAGRQLERRVRLERARRAAPLLPYLTATARLQGQLDAVDERLSQVQAQVPAALTAVGRLALESARAELGRELGRLADSRDQLDALAEQESLQGQASVLAEAAGEASAHASTELTALADRRTAALAALDQLQSAAAQRPAVAARLADLGRTQRALTAQRELAEQMVQAEAIVLARKIVAVDLKEAWLTLREQRLAGIAAELSAGLVDGSPCAVCGSTSHPEPAPARPDGVGHEAELAAQDAAFEADQALASSREHLAALAAGLAEAEERVAGQSVGTLEAAISSAAAELAAAESAVGSLTDARDELSALEARVAELDQLRQVRHTEAAEHRATARAASAQARRLRTRLRALQGADDDVVTKIARLEHEQLALDALIGLIDEQGHLTAQLVAAVDECESAYRAADFVDLADAVTAALTSTEVESLAAAVSAYDEQWATVQAQLGEPELVAAAGEPVPDLVTLEAVATSSATSRRTAEQDHARLEQARIALHRLATELAEHEARHATTLMESELVDSLARCVEGSGGDNVLRMRLSSYVLAARLEQVAAAASERLMAMSDGRYTLVHTDALAKGGVRSGLGLRVVDGWTGVERDTATLSGGESFLASLSLALGLADAVQAESGGAVMHTLFIDEGFGMLDEDTLDEVMTVLDGLREGGRSVGVVSHVPELKVRIPAQLEVLKSRSGSRLVMAQDVA